jgi:glycine/D-amino acid oxidase-like deaminating enzyme
MALQGLINASLTLHREWIVRAGAPERIRETGWLKAWRSDNIAAAKADQNALTEYGIKSKLLDRQAISALEPNILPVYSVGLLHTQTASVDSPGNVVKAYARMLSGSGGEVRRAEIRSIAPDGDGWRAVLSDGELRARHVVVALGPWSADLLRPLGYRVPLATERGYHREYKPNPSRKLLRPIHDAENAFLMTPMEQGIRVTSGVELTDREAPSNYAQIDAVEPLARSVVEFGEQAADDRARAAASQSLACVRQPAHRLHHGAGDRRGDRRNDRRRAAAVRYGRVRAGQVYLRGSRRGRVCTTFGTSRSSASTAICSGSVSFSPSSTPSARSFSVPSSASSSDCCGWDAGA